MSTIEPSPQRRYLNEVLLPRWAPHMGKRVLDVGKSDTWPYAHYFDPGTYKTVDRNPETHPNILIDVEGVLNKEALSSATGVICNGVFEQCSNPFKLRDGLYRMSASDSILVFGAPGLMPFYGDRDRWRITRSGIIQYLEKWELLDLCEDWDSDQYCFAVGKLK